MSVKFLGAAGRDLSAEPERAPTRHARRIGSSSALRGSALGVMSGDRIIRLGLVQPAGRPHHGPHESTARPSVVSLCMLRRSGLRVRDAASPNLADVGAPVVVSLTAGHVLVIHEAGSVKGVLSISITDGS